MGDFFLFAIEQDSARRSAAIEKQLDYIGYMVHSEIYYNNK